LNGTGVIFDLDGTLADTLPDLADAVNAGLKAFGLPEQPASDIREWIGEGLPVLCRRAVGRSAHVPIDEMAVVVTRYYRRHRLDKTTPFAGVPALLDRLTTRGIPMAILSNKPHEHMGPMADALFGRWSFAAVEGYHEESRRKPDPRTALEIVARMQLEPSQVFLVGDSATDVNTARNAGLIPVGATWGYRMREELIVSGARHLIDRPKDLLALLDRRR